MPVKGLKLEFYSLHSKSTWSRMKAGEEDTRSSCCCMPKWTGEFFKKTFQEKPQLLGGYQLNWEEPKLQKLPSISYKEHKAREKTDLF